MIKQLNCDLQADPWRTKYSRTVFTLTPSGVHDHVGVPRAKFKKVFSTTKASLFLRSAETATRACQLIFNKLRVHPVWLILADYAGRINFSERKRNEKISLKMTVWLLFCNSYKIIITWRNCNGLQDEERRKEVYFLDDMLFLYCVQRAPCCALLATAELHSRDNWKLKRNPFSNDAVFGLSKSDNKFEKLKLAKNFIWFLFSSRRVEKQT